MKKRFFYYLLILAVLGGCASVKTKREVTDNVFISTRPKCSVKVVSEFEYLGAISYHRESKDWLGHSTVGYDYNPHMFSSPGKALIIDIRKTQYNFVSDLLGIVKNKLHYGTCKLGNKTYQHYTKLIMTGRGGPVREFYLEKGIVVPNCTLSRNFKRVVGAKENTMINIRYYEKLPDFSPDCSGWENPDNLSERQVEYLKEFNKRCDAAFELLK
jgi:hypothetical protein